MGAFVLGILVGWLAEWLFYTFWVKGGDNADCAALKSQLDEKKREISTLQGKLESALAESAAKKSSPSIAEVLASGSASVSNKKAEPTSKSSTPETVAPAIKQAPQKLASSTTTTTKTKTANKAPAKKSSTKKVADTKSSASKAPAKAKTAAKPKAKTKSATNKGDDFTKLSGIGPSMAATLKELGIDSYTKLASTDDDILRDMLEASGARMNNNKEAMDSWNEQATLAAKGDFDALKKMQEAMKK